MVVQLERRERLVGPAKRNLIVGATIQVAEDHSVGSCARAISDVGDIHGGSEAAARYCLDDGRDERTQAGQPRLQEAVKAWDSGHACSHE
jgi:hypothetical protein